MTLRHIQIFLAVCECGCNVTRASEALHIAQPTVSQAVAEMEGYYGVRLFERLSRRLHLTAAGERFRSYASHVAALFDEMEKGLRDWDSFGMLRVGASITIGSQLLPDFVRTFSDRYPDLDVRVLVERSGALERALMENELDFAFIEGVVHEPSLVSEELMEDELTVVAPPDGPFRAEERIPVETFLTQRILLREKGSGARETFDSILEAAGYSAAPAWESVSTVALVNAVNRGLGMAVQPRRMLKTPLAEGTVIPVRVEGLEFRRRFRIIYHKNKYLTATAEAFLDLCRHWEQETEKSRTPL